MKTTNELCTELADIPALLPGRHAKIQGKLIAHAVELEGQRNELLAVSKAVCAEFDNAAKWSLMGDYARSFEPLYQQAKAAIARTEGKAEQSNIGRRVVSGGYGAGVVIEETAHTLTLHLDKGGAAVVNKAGNIHYERTT